MKKVYLLMLIFILFFPLMIQTQDSVETNEMIEKFTINEKGEYIDGDKSMPGHYEPVQGLHCDSASHVGIISAMDNKGYYITESNAVTKTIDGAVTVLENIGMVTSYVPYGKRFRSYLDTSLTIKLRKKENPVDTGF